MLPGIPSPSDSLVMSLKIGEKASLTLSHILSPGAESLTNGSTSARKVEAEQAPKHLPITLISPTPPGTLLISTATKTGQMQNSSCRSTHPGASDRSEPSNGSSKDLGYRHFPCQFIFQSKSLF